MGGNALALAVVGDQIGVKSKRLHKQDFDNLTKKVVKVLTVAIAKANSMGATIVNEPYEVKAYKQKETFGDLDLLVDKQLFEFVPYEEVMSMLAIEFDYPGQLPYKTKDKKDMVFSLGLPSDEKDVFFQLDLIATDKQYFNFHASYLNWNDLGNLVGVVASSNGFLKYGHDGLKYRFREGDHLFEEYTLILDWAEALEFFGYDVDRYNAGFETLQDIYEYAASSRFFNPELYAFEQRNHVQRTRDKKRPTYNGFLTWIEEQNALGRFDNKEPLNSTGWRTRLDLHYPEFKTVEKEAWARLERNKNLKLYFNGSRVLKFKPELKNKEISDYLNSLKTVIDNYEDFVIEHKENAVELLINLKEAQ